MAGRYSKRVRQEERDVTSSEFECFVCHVRPVREVCNSLVANSMYIATARYDGRNLITPAGCAAHHSRDVTTHHPRKVRPTRQPMMTMLRLRLREWKS